MIAAYELQNIQPILDLYVYSYLRTCMAYDSTVKAIGLDEIRVRYRQQRRELVRDLILNKIDKSSIKQYINKRTTQLIKETDRADFIQDVLEDIDALDKSRIIGLGITIDQLNSWLKLINAG